MMKSYFEAAVVLAFCLLVTFGCTQVPEARPVGYGFIQRAEIFCSPGPDLDAMKRAQLEGDLEAVSEVMYGDGRDCFDTNHMGIMPAHGKVLGPPEFGCWDGAVQLIYYRFLAQDNMVYVTWGMTGLDCEGGLIDKVTPVEGLDA